MSAPLQFVFDSRSNVNGELERIFREAKKGYLPKREKLSLVLDFIASIRWTFTDFFWELLEFEDSQGNKIERTSNVQHVVRCFLRGDVTYTVAKIINKIMQHPSSRPKPQSAEAGEMFSQTKPYLTMKHALPAITTLALELVVGELLSEMRTVVKGVNGLHGSQQSSSTGGRRQLSWKDIGAETPGKVQDIFKTHQPLGFYVISRLVTPPSKTVGAVVVSRKMRPSDLTTTEILSTIAYCRTPYARLGPMFRGILYFACSTQQSIFHYSSRIGHIPSYTTILATLKRLADEQGQFLYSVGRDPERSLIARSDNCQQYVAQWEPRVGRENHMKIGMSAIVNEVLDYDPKAFDLDDKLHRIRTSKRAELQVSDLTQMMDARHNHIVGSLQWLQALVDYIPQLAFLKPKVAELYRTEGAKLLPRELRKTEVYSLRTVAKNETIATEFRDATLEFLKQVGQERGNFIRRLIFFGGDGLTFERILQHKGYMRFHGDDIDRGDIIQGYLETWHTGATHVNLVYETHWGEPLTKDISKLGHSAAKINRKAPANLKKVDYYPGIHMMWLVLDVRMLDCWRILFDTEDLSKYFDDLAYNNQLPSFEELRAKAEILYRRYSTRRAYLHARKGDYPTDVSASETFAVPASSEAWVPQPVEESSVQKKATREAKKKNKKVEPPFTGDQALADSIMFMHDAILSREFALAVAQGDYGRVWEAMKRMLFSFAGSSHSKYAGYLLEMITSFELESSPELKEAFMRNILINPSGERGRYIEGDLHLEHINLVLEDMIQRKNSEWDGNHIRNVIAPNATRFLAIKDSFREGVGLAKRRTKHTSPHDNPEIRILLKEYARDDLHRFMKGRCYGDPKVSIDTFELGVKALEDGKLKKWIAESMRTRKGEGGESAASAVAATNPAGQTATRASHNSDTKGGSDGEDTEEPAFGGEELEAEMQTQGRVSVVDGRVTVDYDDEVNWLEFIEEGEREMAEMEAAFRDEALE